MSTASDIVLLQFEFAWDVQVGGFVDLVYFRRTYVFADWNLQNIIQIIPR